MRPFGGHTLVGRGCHAARRAVRGMARRESECGTVGANSCPVSKGAVGHPCRCGRRGPSLRERRGPSLREAGAVAAGGGGRGPTALTHRDPRRPTARYVAVKWRGGHNSRHGRSATFSELLVEADRDVARIAAALGAEVRTTRRERHMTQEQLARLVGVDRSWVSRIERGKGSGAPLQVWAALGRAISRPVSAQPGARCPSLSARCRPCRDPRASAPAGEGPWAGRASSSSRRDRATRSGRD